MRIALDATYSIDRHPSGIAIYSRELLRGLPRLSLEDMFFYCYRPKQWRQRLPPELPNVRNRLLLRPFTLGRPHLFHALNQRVEPRRAKVVVTTFHDLFVMTADYSTADFRRRFTRLAQEAADRSDAIIAVSEFTAGQVRDLLGVPSSRIRVIPHGVDLPPESRPGTREKMILSVGTLQRRKNIQRLVQAFEQMADQSWTLVLAGAPGGYGSAEVMEQIHKSPSRGRITVAGYLDNAALSDLYARASIFAFPSLDEGFGIPVLEAMAHHLPVVTSNSSALPEVAGNAALCVDPENVGAIANALSALAADPELRKELGDRGRKRAGQFGWNNAVLQTRKLYRELTGR